MKMKGGPKIYKIPEASSKKLFGCSGAFVGFAGDADKFADVIQWLVIPDDKVPRISGIEMLLLTSKNEIFHGTNLRNWLRIGEPFYSVGSGMHYAQAAMASGKTPSEAIKIASKFDPMTGMGVKEYSFEE